MQAFTKHHELKERFPSFFARKKGKVILVGNIYNGRVFMTREPDKNNKQYFNIWRITNDGAIRSAYDHNKMTSDAEARSMLARVAKALRMADGGQYVDFTILPNGDLKISIAKGKMVKAEIQEISDHPTKHRDTVLAEILEDILCNSPYELLPEWDYEKVGALTASPLISYDTIRDDSTDELQDVKEVWWFPEYAIVDPVEVLLEKGEVVFTNGRRWDE